jgi:hypothetical protein
MEECSTEKLNEFSNEHYTYINQIFGDASVREIISEIKKFQNKQFEFATEKTGRNFEYSAHHVLIDKKTKETVCSVDNGYQNININKNDTLCQSYSLLTYLNIDINDDQQDRQMDMIAMYREILSNRLFLKKIDEIILNEANKKLWTDYTQNTKKFIVMDKQKILNKINDVLDKWEAYGYRYFIGKGKGTCNNKRKRGGISRKKRKSRKQK